LRRNQNLGNSNQRNGMVSATSDTILSDINSHESFKNSWIGDSGESCHYCNSDEVLFDQKTISEMITVEKGGTMKAEMVGKLGS
jgi:hypothetical protein